MTSQVFLSEKAQHDLNELPAKIANQILIDCRRISADPIPDGKRIKKLKGLKENLYRLRAGDYRILFKRSGSRIDVVRVLSKEDFEHGF